MGTTKTKKRKKTKNQKIMSGISDVDLTKAVDDYVSNVDDLSTVTVKSARKALEAKLAVSFNSDEKNKVKEMMQKKVTEITASQQAKKEESEAEEEDEESFEESEESEEKPKKNSAPKKRAKKDPNAPKKPRVVSDEKKTYVSKQLFDVIGIERSERFEVVKLVWKYIKDHHLQDENDKRMILCDEKLKKVFNQDKVSGFSMSRYWTQHLLPKDDERGPGNHEITVVEPPVKSKPDKPKKAKGAKKKGSPRAPKVKKPWEKQPFVSVQMAAVIGQDRVNDRFELSKLVWDYIKSNKLQSKNDGRKINCDEKFAALFGGEKKVVGMMEMTKFWTQHILTPDEGAPKSISVVQPATKEGASKKRKVVVESSDEEESSESLELESDGPDDIDDGDDDDEDEDEQ